MKLHVPQNAGNVACFLAGRAKDLSASLNVLWIQEKGTQIQ
jgi:hypothetical protein